MIKQTLQEPSTDEKELQEYFRQSPSSLSTASTDIQTVATPSPPTTEGAVLQPDEPLFSIIGKQFTAEANRLFESRMNPFEKFDAMGRLLCKISAYYNKIAEDPVLTDQTNALPYIEDVYNSSCDLYGEILEKLLQRAQNNKNFFQFFTIVDKIPNRVILDQAEDIIARFEYAPHLHLLMINKEISRMLVPSNLIGLANYSKKLKQIYSEYPSNITKISHFLVRAILLKNILQKYNYLPKIKANNLIPDFIFITNAIKELYYTTQNNHELRNMLNLDKFWHDFVTLSIKLLKQHICQDYNLQAITDLNADNLETMLGFLLATYMDRVLKPEYFMEIKAEIKPVPTNPPYMQDRCGEAMLAHYRNRRSKIKIILAHNLDLKTIESTIKHFETYLGYIFPTEILKKFLCKTELLQRRYIEESFQKYSDTEKLLEYYAIYATRADQIEGVGTLDMRIRPLIHGYYFNVAELLANRYFEINGESIPPLDFLQDYMPCTSLSPSI
jgi:hypothetical protein